MNSCVCTPRAARHRRRLRGFTLPELMLAATLGAALLASVASAVGSMTQTVAYLESDSTDAYDKALARITRDVRYAWWVDTPSATQLRVADNANRVTEYYRVGNSLLVRLPSGDEGAVVTGLDSVGFATDSVQRLREGTVRTVSGTIYTQAAPPTIDGGQRMLPGNQLALGFTVASNAGAGSVAGVNEGLLSFTPTRFDLRVARATATGLMRVDFYPARAPGDSRPRPGAASLGGFDVALVGLPAATTLIPGPLGDITQAIYAAPTAMVPLAVPAFSSPLSPGTSYTIVLTVRAGSMTVVAGHLSTTGARSDMQFRNNGAASWTALAGVFPFVVSGDERLTATSGYTVASAVHATLDPTVGDPRNSSAPVYSQMLATDPWLGVVPGESAPAP
ncbi:MAG TPA: prepilin-type N-terminal cleavage/methylation domain-containing protein [Candidatus Limnocylindrales bacterium]|nr:prepilin-type N-terminal cleavage/methylation domain-containing protein [Candidatus Limnocylindrales bacterium]